MIKLLTGITLALSLTFIPPVMAEEAPSTEILRLCAELESTAGVIQELRQGGDSMSEVMALIGHNEILANITILAWKKSIMLHEENQRKVVQEFKNEIYMLCIEGDL